MALIALTVIERIAVRFYRLVVWVVLAGTLLFLLLGATSLIQGGSAALGVLFTLLTLAFYMVFSAGQFLFIMYILSRPRSYTTTPDQPQLGLSFNDYRGQPDLLEHARTTVRILSGVEDFKRQGGEMPKGMLLYGKPGTGKCVVGDTRVITQWGYHRIADLHPARDPESLWPLGAPVATPDGIRTASHFYVGGRSRTIRIRTRHGYELEGTPEHPLLALRPGGRLEWTALKELTEHDYVAVERNVRAWGTEHEPEAYVLGCFIGDGHIVTGRQLRFSTVESEMLAPMQTWARSHGWEFRQATKKCDYWLGSSAAVAYVNHLGLPAALAQYKRVPERIWQGDEWTVREFLRGLFDCDGHSDRRAGYIEFASASEGLAHDVQLLLLKFGVICRVADRRAHYFYKGARLDKRSWRLTMSGDAARLFYERVGFALPRKQAGLERLPEKANTNSDVIPNIGPLLVGCEARYREERRLPSYETLERMAEERALGDPSIRWLLAHRPFWAKVVGKSEGEAEVYDLTVPDGHAFIANGLISHNTFLAGVIAAEAKLPFIYVDATSLSSMFFGVDALIVMQLFGKARALARKYAKAGWPGVCLLFIDELDAVGASRGGTGGPTSAMAGGMFGGRFALNTLLNQMDSLGQFTEDRWTHRLGRWLGVITGPVPPKPTVFVIGATNRPDVLDPALTRPGRLDRQLNVYEPDGDGRRDILAHYLSKKAHVPDLPIELMVADSIGWTPIEIKTMVNEALIVAHQASRSELTYKDWLAARDVRMLGLKQPIARMLPHERRAIAYHEAGHAVAAYYLQQQNRIQKASIIRMGDALGVVQRSPREERYTRHAAEIETDIMVSLASRAVEETILGTRMSGASSDLQSASSLAAAYVTLGMGASLFIPPASALGGMPGAHMRAADELLQQLMLETKRLVTEKSYAVDAVAQALIERGELIGSELEEVFRAADEEHADAAVPFERRPVVLRNPFVDEKNGKDDKNDAVSPTDAVTREVDALR